MGVIDRVSRLVRANVNDLLDQAEDPEMMIDQIMRDMESNIADARKQVAAMIAQEKELEYDRDETQKLADAWGDKAQRAVEANKDDLAREALRRQKDYADNAALYDQQLIAQKEAVTKLKASSRSSKRNTIKREASATPSLLARNGRERKPRSPDRSTLPTSRRWIRAPILIAWSARSAGQEAQTAAMLEMQDDSIDAQFAELDYDSDIEERLAALKASVQPSAEIPA